MGLPSRSIDDLLREGVLAHQAGRLEMAERAYRTVLRDEPGHADAEHLLGVVAHQAGRHDAAVAHIRAAIRRRPRVADYHSNLGDALLALGRAEEAIRAYRRALGLLPDAARIHNKLGVALKQAGRPEAALAAFREAAARDPAYPIGLSNQGVTARELGRFDEARAALERVVALIPADSAAHGNLGNLLVDAGALDAGEAAYRTALRLDAKNREAAFGLSTLLLSTGRWDEGWRLFEARWHVGGHRPRDLPGPTWSGEPLAGRTLLVHAEQGFGDTLQFARYLPAINGGRIVLEAPRPVLRLLDGQGWGIATIARGDKLPEFDLYVPLMSLAGLMPDERCETSYLRAPDASAWAARVAALPGRRIGLCWAGNPDYEADRKRSIPPALLRPLSGIPGVTWISLQKDARPGRHPALVDWTGELTDFVDTAALITTLDLVIAVDTAVAHLAGALGRPVWLLNRADTCWRWGRAGETTHLYPSMRIFRQDAPGDWEGVLARVAEALRACVAPGIAP